MYSLRQIKNVRFGTRFRINKHWWYKLMGDPNLNWGFCEATRTSQLFEPDTFIGVEEN